MNKQNSSLYTFTLNKLLVGGFMLLILGGVGQYALQQVQGKYMKSSASSPCSRERAFVQAYINSLIQTYSSQGLVIPGHKMILLEDAYANMIEICLDDQTAMITE